MNFFTNWKTTSAGIVMIVGALVTFFFVRPVTPEVIVSATTAILGGIGLIFAKDKNVTGGTVDQGTAAQIIDDPKIAPEKK